MSKVGIARQFKLRKVELSGAKESDVTLKKIFHLYSLFILKIFSNVKVIGWNIDLRQFFGTNGK